MYDKKSSPYGTCGLVEFKNYKDRVVFICIWKALFALRFSNYDAHLAAQWCMVLWRVLRFEGSDNQLQKDKFLGKFGGMYDTQNAHN